MGETKDIAEIVTLLYNAKLISRQEARNLLRKVSGVFKNTLDDDDNPVRAVMAHPRITAYPIEYHGPEMTQEEQDEVSRQMNAAAMGKRR